MSDPGSKPALSNLTEAEAIRRRRLLALWLLVVAALFSGAVAGVLAALSVAGAPMPQDDPTVLGLQAALDKAPTDAVLQDVLRQEDVQRPARAGIPSWTVRLPCPAARPIVQTSSAGSPAVVASSPRH